MEEKHLPEEAIAYLREKNIPAVMEHLLRELVLHRPEDPLSFLSDLLAAPVVPRIVMIGPPASGKRTQGELLQQRYGLVRIATAELMRDEVKQGTHIGKVASVHLDKGELVPDEVVVEAVLSRLQRADAKQTGWLLDGFPRTRAQALALQAAGVLPRVCVVLELPESLVIERVDGRRVDPVTGRTYHLSHDPPSFDDTELVQRLEQRADDNRDAVRRRLAAYNRNSPEVIDCYQTIVTKLNGDRDKQEIFDDLDAVIRTSMQPRASTQP
eukprot:TRINITY_DN4039_c0_g1_i1.p1 TRINITY_DN4039_c0_g1~~TRINITY_DN4039_c0_g1_i1.p1  ORF type:complete len:300 (+),score=92.14 TRINITY_DN4039_c0_g1_i1:94-900(+)